MALFGMSVGVKNEQPARRPRLPLEAIYFEDRYPPDATLLEAIDAYDQQMAGYYRERGKDGYDWSGGIARKFDRPRREHLLEYYRSKGARWR